MTHPCIQNQFQISLHDLTMASVALSAPRMGSACSVSRDSHSVLTDTTNKAQNAKMELAIHMHLKEKASVAHGKWQVQRNSVKGVLDGLGINPNKVYYELSKKLLLGVIRVTPVTATKTSKDKNACPTCIQIT
jgi:hypothetical protein